MKNRITILFYIKVLFIFVIAVNVTLAQNSQNQNFEEMLNDLDVAIYEFLNGQPNTFKTLWSKSDDITISGGFGGKIEKGWDAISVRLDRVGTVYSKAEFSTERVSSKSNGKLGYLVQHESISFYGPDDSVESKRNYRVTMIFQLEAEGWRILHRHADSNMNWQAPE